MNDIQQFKSKYVTDYPLPVVPHFPADVPSMQQSVDSPLKNGLSHLEQVATSFRSLPS
jgi:hypothetical protein